MAGTTFEILEQTTGVYRATITDEGGAMLPASTLSTLKLTLYVKTAAGNVYINSRNEQNVLNANGVLVYDTLQTDTLSDGTQLTYNLKWVIAALDTTLNNSNLKTERHIALFEWTWPTDKQGKHEVILAVKNLTEV
jgi:hypothetical protein